METRAHMLCTNQVYYLCLPYGRDTTYKPALLLSRDKNCTLTVHYGLSLTNRGEISSFFRKKQTQKTKKTLGVYIYCVYLIAAQCKHN